jgi:threonine-phosphate decarboxylase
MIRGHGGNIYALAKALGCRPEAIIDMSSNVNPFGPPPGLLTHLKERLLRIGALPEVDARSAVERFAHHCGLPAMQVAIASGTTQLIYQLPRALKTKRALIIGPTYADYRDGCARHRVESVLCLAGQENSFHPDVNAFRADLKDFDTVYVCNPNNPTGTLIGRQTLADLCREFPATRFIVDESYLPFVQGREEVTLVRDRPPNALVLHSMSKIFRIPGLRIGFAIGEAEIIRCLEDHALPWNINSLALEAVHYLLDAEDAMAAFVRDTQDRLAYEQTAMLERLSVIPGLHVFPSATGFFLVRLPASYQSSAVCRKLAEEKILVRDCANFEGLSDRFIRISLQDGDTNRRCARALEAVLMT